METKPIAAGPLEAPVMPADEQIARLRRGNTDLLEALMDMVNQFFYHKNEHSQSDEDGEFISHAFMSAEEGAIAVLIDAGMAEEVKGKGYRLLWDNLEARKQKRQTWAEAVNECVNDPDERARLLALDDKPHNVWR